MAEPVVSTVSFQRLRIRCLRNLARLDFEPGPGLNLIFGDNGQGKTSVLEALYLVATSRSFRAERLAELISEGEASATVSADILESGLVREQRAVVGKKERSFFLAGKKPTSMAEFAVQTPVVVFHPGDLGLVAGAATVRRRLLRRVALYASPRSAEDRVRLAYAARSRQRVLQTRGIHAPELEALEAVMARHGVRYGAALANAAQDLILALKSAFERLSAPTLSFEARHRPGGSLDEAEYQKALAERRVLDTERRSQTFGPSRDELVLEILGRSARKHASQGQQRILALGLKLAELDCVRSLRNKNPVLLLDDVSSELDPARTLAVYDFLAASQSQIFLTTTRRELFTTPWRSHHENSEWRVQAGQIERA